MINDIESENDYLNFRPVVEYIVETIRQSGDEPFSIGISGNWGTGKSSLTQMVESKIGKSEDSSSYILVNFDAWLCQGYDDARNLLIMAVFDALKKKASENTTIFAKVKDKFKDLIRKLNWLKVACKVGSVAAGAAIMHSGDMSLSALFPLLAIFADESRQPTRDELKKIRECIASLPEDISAYSREAESPRIPAEITAVRHLFKDILDSLRCRLVVFIDDLDRCLPDTAISTLEAMRLLLFIEGSVFVVAADERMIRNSVKVRFGREDMDDDMVTSYFDKLVQMPISVPRPGVNEIKSYLFMLFLEHARKYGTLNGVKLPQTSFDQAYGLISEKLKTSWKCEITKEILLEAAGAEIDNLKIEIEIADQIAGIMTAAKEIEGNPRLVKRFLNNLIMRYTLAKQHGMGVDFETVVKMQLLERCGSKTAFDTLAKASLQSNDGKVAFLSEAESALEEGKEMDNLQGEWRSNEFLKSWLLMSPKLGNTDLRPLFYLSRTAFTLQLSPVEMSKDGKQVLDILLNADTYRSSLDDDVRKLELPDVTKILNILIRKSRADGFSARSILRMLPIPKVFPDAQGSFLDFLQEVPPDKRASPLFPILKDCTWAQKILLEWKNDKNTDKHMLNLLKRLP